MTKLQTRVAERSSEAAMTFEKANFSQTVRGQILFRTRRPGSLARQLIVTRLSAYPPHDSIQNNPKSTVFKPTCMSWRATRLKSLLTGLPYWPSVLLFRICLTSVLCFFFTSSSALLHPMRLGFHLRSAAAIELHSHRASLLPLVPHKKERLGGSQHSLDQLAPRRQERKNRFSTSSFASRDCGCNRFRHQQSDRHAIEQARTHRATPRDGSPSIMLLRFRCVKQFLT